MPKSATRLLAVLATAALAAAPLSAQIRTVDPSSPQVSSDLAPVPAGDDGVERADTPPPPPPPPAASRPPLASRPPAPSAGSTYEDEDVFTAAEGVFGRGAEGLAKLLEKVLAEQGKPTAYITGREAGGAFAVGLRYGSGELHHKVEGDRNVFWTGPSVGFDIGGNAGKTFVLVYNLYDSEELFHRFPAAEGAAYVIGGFTASYMRRGDVVLIPIRLGVGWRLGANVGYMNFTRESRWLPF